MRTPGKWTYRETPKDGSELHNSHWIDASDGKKPIADVKEYYEGEGEANARLLAAAPELLEACKTLLAKESALTTGDLYLEFRDIEAAIKAAEGSE